MNGAFAYRRALQLGLGLALGAAALPSQAQTSARSVRPVPQRQAPVLGLGAVGPGAPSPAGLASPIPNPAGLTSRFPAGLPPPTDTASVPSTDVTQPSTGTGAGGRPSGADTVAPQTAVMGYGAPAAPLPSGAGHGPYTALQIAQSFLGADANRDGELTRAEAQRLTLMPYTFEEMDRNHDGILTRFEYEDAMR